MSREKDSEEHRRDDVEKRIMSLLAAEITYDEMGEIFDDARRYRALKYFVDGTENGTITAGGVYAFSEDDEYPPAPEHLSSEDGDLSATSGMGLDVLADFLDANRRAGVPISARNREAIGERAFDAMKRRDTNA